MFSNERAVRTLPFNHSARAISFKPFVKPARQRSLQKFPPKVPSKPSVKTMPSVAILDRALCCVERVRSSRAAMEPPGPGLEPEGPENPIDDLMIPKSIVKVLLGKRKVCPHFKTKMLGSAFQRARVCRSSYALWCGILTHYWILSCWRCNCSTPLRSFKPLTYGWCGASPSPPSIPFQCPLSAAVVRRRRRFPRPVVRHFRPPPLSAAVVRRRPPPSAPLRNSL